MRSIGRERRLVRVFLRRRSLGLRVYNWPRACVRVRGSPDRDADITVLLDRYPITAILSVISHGVYSLIGSFLHFLALGEFGFAVC